MSTKRTLSDDSDNESADNRDLSQKKKMPSYSSNFLSKRKQEDFTTNDNESKNKFQKISYDTQKPSNIGEKLLVLKPFNL
jgi:hypothetical protein